MRYLACLHVVLRSRKGRHRLAVTIVRVPSAVIEMQMGVDDDVDLIGRDACPLETLHQLHLVLVDVLLLFTELRTNTCLNQHGLLAVTKQQRVGSDFQHVARVGLDAFFPEHLGHYPKKRSTVQLIRSVRQNEYLKISNRGSNHALLPSSTRLSSPGRRLRGTNEGSA